MINARLQRSGFFLCSSLLVIGSLCAVELEGESAIYQAMIEPMFFTGPETDR